MADDKGYRELSREMTPVGEGPEVDRQGSAIVQQVVAGVETQYAIRAEPIEPAKGGDEDEGEGRSGERYVEITEPLF